MFFSISNFYLNLHYCKFYILHIYVMLFLVLTILIIIYFISIPQVRKAKFGANVALALRIIVFVATPILLALLILETYNIYPKQYWITKGFFWLVYFSCMSAFGLCSREYFRPVERAIYKIIFFLPLIFILFLFVPFIGIGSGLLFYVKFIGDNKFILYNDNKIRIEQPYIRFMGPDPPLILYVKKKLTSFQDTTLPFGYDDINDKIEVIKNADSSYIIILKSPNNWQVPTGTDTFFYNLRNNHE
jgi:hypothetical protein